LSAVILESEDVVAGVVIGTEELAFAVLAQTPGVQGGKRRAVDRYCLVRVVSFAASLIARLEMRAAQHVKSLDTYIHVWDICLLLEKLWDHQLAEMNDPKGAARRFSACSSDATREDSLSKLRTAAVRSRKALDSYNDNDFAAAFYYLDLLFGGNFPAR
jgi:hypothetical protein